MARHREIAKGQLWRKRDAVGDVWEVVAIRTDMLGNTHAQLRHVDEPFTFRTLALSVLSDPRQFEYVGEAGPASNFPLPPGGEVGGRKADG